MHQEPKSFKIGSKHATLCLEGDSVFILLSSKCAVCHSLSKIFAIQASIERENKVSYHMCSHDSQKLENSWRIVSQHFGLILMPKWI